MRCQLIGGQILVCVNLHRYPVLLAGLRMSSPHYSTRATNRHVSRESNFRRHGESQLDRRSFGESCLGIKENSATGQILSETWNSSSIEVDRYWQMHFKTLRQPALQTIRFGAHGGVLQIQLLDRCN
jgi:hypothetical protein